MSVPESKRGPNRLEVFIQARYLAKYTIQICSNEKIFKPKYQSAITDDIIRIAKDIFADIWAANNIRVIVPGENGEKIIIPERAKERHELQKKAEWKCTQLIAMIQIAKPVFHLTMKRVKYWGNTTKRVQTLIKSWSEADRKRYSK